VKKVARFFRLAPRDRRLVLEAALMLAVSSVLLSVFRFQRLARHLGRHMSESGAVEPAQARQSGDRIGWAVTGVAHVLPWHPVCLPQAVAAKLMLRRRRIPSTLYMGIDSRGYDAHAWVRVGDRIVTGGPATERFSVVSTFS
jgi:hypothetical protein